MKKTSQVPVGGGSSAPPEAMLVCFKTISQHGQAGGLRSHDVVAAWLHFRPPLEGGAHSMTCHFLDGGELGQVFTVWKQPELLAGLAFCADEPEARWAMQAHYARKFGVSLHPVPPHLVPENFPNVQRLLALLQGGIGFATGDFAMGGGVDMPQIVLYGSELELAVWRALMDIPAGETRSYGQVAQAIGRPEAVRAVASAIGRNPVSLLVPCHRVVREDGTPGGYAGGLKRKQILLRREGVELEI